MNIRAGFGRLPSWVTFWALAGASLLVAHDAVFLAQLGPGEPLARALRGGGHAYWEGASTVLLGLTVLSAIVVGFRIRGLRARAQGLSITPDRRGRGTLAMRLWLRLFAVVAVGFAIQENVEHLASHDHFIGLGALHGMEYPLALPVLAAVTLLASLVGAVALGMERELLAVIASAARRRVRAPRAIPRPPLRLVIAHASPLALHGAGRAPPHRLFDPLIG